MDHDFPAGPLNVFDFGAGGDGRTDDTAAIQNAINFAARRGGGKIFFPYTKTGYRIASPGMETLNGRPLRSQLYIPAGFQHNIQLEGEMPCRAKWSTIRFAPGPRISSPPEKAK